jgi:hypothetical protein
MWTAGERRSCCLGGYSRPDNLPFRVRSVRSFTVRAWVEPVFVVPNAHGRSCDVFSQFDIDHTLRPDSHNAVNLLNNLVSAQPD